MVLTVSMVYHITHKSRSTWDGEVLNQVLKLPVEERRVRAEEYNLL